MKKRIMDILTDYGTLPIYVIPLVFTTGLVGSAAWIVWCLARLT